MLCQECRKRAATVHLTQIINNEQSVQHLCEQCAREKSEFNFQMPAPFSIQNLLTGLLNMEAAWQGQTAALVGKLHCENCGLTFTQFGQIGRFGCSRCYTVFSDRLLPMFRRIHGSTRHAGKVPVRAGGMLKVRRSIDDLRRQLQRLVEREEFEKAAQVRDRIRELENSLAEGGGRDA